MSEKRRLSATVDEEHLAAAHRAAAEGRSASVSAWVNDALARHARHEARMRALDKFLAPSEAEHGEISDAEMEAAARNARGRAVVVRGGAPPPKNAGRSDRRRP